MRRLLQLEALPWFEIDGKQSAIHHSKIELALEGLSWHINRYIYICTLRVVCKASWIASLSQPFLLSTACIVLLFDMQSVTLMLLTAVAVYGMPQDKTQSRGALDRRLMNGLGKTPALGWNSWVRSQQEMIPLAYFQCEIRTNSFLESRRLQRSDRSNSYQHRESFHFPWS